MENGLHIALSSKLLKGRNKENADVDPFYGEEWHQLRMLNIWLKVAAWCGVYLYEGKAAFDVIGTRSLPLPKKCMDVATLCEWVKNHIKKELKKEGCDAALERIENYELKKTA